LEFELNLETLARHFRREGGRKGGRERERERGRGGERERGRQNVFWWRKG
jgi:hypothetical protein